MTKPLIQQISPSGYNKLMESSDVRNEMGPSIAALNNAAIEHFKNGRPREAKWCLSNAFSKINPSVEEPNGKRINNTMLSYVNNKGGFGAEMMAQTDIHCTNETQHVFSHSKEGLSEHDCQHDEYNEGMQVFPDLIQMDDAPPGRRVAAYEAFLSTIMYNMGQIHVHCKKYQGALPWFEGALEAFFKAFITNHFGLAKVAVYHNIGYCLYHLGRYQEALACYYESMDSATSTTITARTLNCVAVVRLHCSEGNSDRILELLSMSLGMLRKVLGSNSAEVATVLNNMGRMYFLRTEYETALKMYKLALKIRSSILGYGHIDVAVILYNIGQSHHEQGRLEEAMKFYQQFHRIALQHFGEGHRDVAVVMRLMAKIYRTQGHLDEAFHLLHISLNCASKAIGDAHPEVAAILNEIGTVLYLKRNFPRALVYFENVLTWNATPFQSTMNPST